MQERPETGLPTPLIDDPSKKSGSGGDSPDITRWITNDFVFAEDGRREREDLWDQYWKLFLAEKRRTMPKGRSNSVGPHGGLVVRGLLPMIKRAILSTRPFVRGETRKRELFEMMPLLNARIDYWIDAARIRQIVLTHMLKESLVFGVAWGKCANVVYDHATVQSSVEPNFEGLLAETLQETNEIDYVGPWCHFIPTEDAYPYPKARDLTELQRSGYFCHRMFKLKSELLEDPLYDNDLVEEITSGETRSGMRNHAIPLDRMFEERRRRVLGLTVDQWKLHAENARAKGDEPVEIIEHISNGKVYALANRGVVIREDALDHPFPIFSLCPDPIPGEIFGKSVYHDALSSIDQRDFLVNNIHDNIARLVHRTMKGIPGMYDKSTLVPAPGGVVSVRDMNALQPLEQGDIVSSAFAMLTHIDRDIERGTGYSEILSTIGAGAGTVYPETATVGSIKSENALLFVGEMISNIEEDGLKRMVEIFFDLQKENLSRDDWVALSGEEGARWRDVSLDTLARNIDWKIIGSSYAADKTAKANAVQAATGTILQLKAAQPDLIDLREFASTYLDALGVPNSDRIVKGEPTDVGPEAEHETMRQGFPVKPEPGENLQAHLQAHAVEFQRATEEDGEDPGFIERLMEHIQATQDLIQRVQQAQQIMMAEAQGAGIQQQRPGSNGESSPRREGGASSGDSGGGNGAASGPV